MNKLFKIYLPCILLHVFCVINCRNAENEVDYTILYLDEQQLNFLTEDDALLVDTRSADAFNSAHFPNSVNITTTMVKYQPKEVMKVLTARQYNRIVVYCYGNTCDTSSFVSRHLVYTGKDIFVFKPGWEIIRNLVPKS